MREKKVTKTSIERYAIRIATKRQTKDQLDVLVVMLLFKLLCKDFNICTGVKRILDHKKIESFTNHRLNNMNMNALTTKFLIILEV